MTDNGADRQEPLDPHLTSVNLDDICHVTLTDSGVAARYLGIDQTTPIERDLHIPLRDLLFSFGSSMVGPALFENNSITFSSTNQDTEPRTLNANDSVSVEVTPSGKAIYEKYFQDAKSEIVQRVGSDRYVDEGLHSTMRQIGQLPPPDEHGLTRLTFHEVAQIFGPHLRNTAQGTPPIGNTISFKQNNLRP